MKKTNLEFLREQEVKKVTFCDETQYEAGKCNDGGCYGFYENYRRQGDGTWLRWYSTTADFDYCPVCGCFADHEQTEDGCECGKDVYISTEELVELINGFQWSDDEFIILKNEDGEEVDLHEYEMRPCLIEDCDGGRTTVFGDLKAAIREAESAWDRLSSSEKKRILDGGDIYAAVALLDENGEPLDYSEGANAIFWSGKASEEIVKNLDQLDRDFGTVHFDGWQKYVLISAPNFDGNKTTALAIEPGEELEGEAQGTYDVLKITWEGDEDPIDVYEAYVKNIEKRYNALKMEEVFDAGAILAPLKKEHGSCMFEGKEYVFLSAPFQKNADEYATYALSPQDVPDVDGWLPRYEITWEILEDFVFERGEEYACDWDEPYEVAEVGTYDPATGASY